jgi:hypothetical protein
MEFVPVAAMALLVFTIINFIRFVVNGDKNGIVTTLSVWFAGVVVVLLVAQSDFADGIIIAEKAMSAYNTASLIFLGLTVSSVGVFANEIRGALDNSDSTKKPHLLDKNID